MTEPLTPVEERTLRRALLRTTSPDRRIFATLDAERDRMIHVRTYVANNLRVWDNDKPVTDQVSALEAAYADIYRTILNMIDYGHPRPPQPPEEGPQIR